MRIEMKRAVSFALALALFSTLFFAQPTLTKDYAYGAHWADVNMNRLANKNVMRGDEMGNFNPDRNITRAEFAAMLNRAFGFQERKGSTFSDVLPESWYADDISFASYQGFFQGLGGGVASPNGNLTREEAVTMICRAIKIEPRPVDSMQFADSRNFAAWSRGFINAAAEKGLINGYGDGTFRPGNPITRGEVAKLLDTVAGEIVNQPSQAYLGYVNGNVTLSKSGAGLRDTVITGDLYITEGVLDGFVFLENVTVLGTIYISGAGEAHAAASSIVMTDCDINNIIIDLNHGKKVSLIAQGNTEIKNTVVKTLAYLEENNTRSSAFNDIQLRGPAGTKLDLSGEFTEVKIMAPGNEVMLNKGSIDRLVSDEVAIGAKLFLERNTILSELYIDGNLAVTGSGKIEFVSIGANGSNIAQMPGEIQIRPGYSATINGRPMGHLDAEQENLTPRIHNNYPQVRDITANTATGQLLGNKPGTIYWAVKEKNTDTPTVEQMKDPKKGDTNILQSGSMPLLMAAVENETELAARIAGLKNGGEYELYAMLVDSRGIASRVRSIDFETLDKVAPAFVSGYPRGRAESREAITSGSAILLPAEHDLVYEIVPTKNCEVFYIVMPDKGAAPNADRLFAGNGMAGEVKHGKLTGVEENKVTLLTIKGLDESTLYDVYIGLRDARGNVSSVNKTSIRTKDVTAPEFLIPYPMIGVRTDRQVEIQYMTNEVGTLYWAVLARGSNFPPGAPTAGNLTTDMGDIVSYWSSVPAQQAVRSGSGAIRSANVRTVVDRVGSVQITNLVADTAYDLYLMMEDSSGNRSVVGKMEIMTLSVTAPTASMRWEDTVAVGERPPVGSNIMIAFNKPVRAGKPARGNAPAEPPVDLIKMEPTELERFIELFAIDNAVRTPVPIDFEKVFISEGLGFTMVHFPTSSSAGAAIQLETGRDYYFELNSIQDLSGRPMAPLVASSNPMNTEPVFRIPSFTMRAAGVELSDKWTGIGDDRNYEAIFEIESKAPGGAARDLMYETVIETNRKIQIILCEFDLNPDGTFTRPGREYSSIIMNPGEFYLIGELTKGSGEYDFTRFNDITKKQYGIKIQLLDDRPKPWTGNVAIGIYGVAGRSQAINEIRFPDSAYSGLVEVINNSRFGAQIVSDAIGFAGGRLECLISFRDDSAPNFVGDPKLEPGDIAAGIRVTVDKPSTVYWFVTPAIGSEVPDVTAGQLISGTELTGVPGSRWGTIRVPTAGFEFPGTVQGLTANMDYHFFCMAQSSVSPATSEIYHERFTTIPPARPEWATGFPMPSLATKEGEARVDVQFSNTSSEVYWVLYPRGAMSSMAAIDVFRIGESGLALQAGSIGVSPPPPLAQGVRGTIIIDKLPVGQWYDLFITAIHPMADKNVAINFTPTKTIDVVALDTRPPGIDQVTSTMIKNEMTGMFNGFFNIDFSGPLFWDSDGRGKMEPLGAIQFRDSFFTGLAEVAKTPAGIPITTNNVDGYTTPAVRSARINFINAVLGEAMTVRVEIGTETAVIGGGLTMELVSSATAPSGAAWRVYFDRYPGRAVFSDGRNLY